MAVIQARLGSSRLPRKVLTGINGKPLLARVVERVCAMPGLTESWPILAAPALETGPLVEAVRQALGYRIPWVGGDEHDVLSRVITAARQFHIDTVVRVTADCPLWAPDVAGLALEEFVRQDVDYLGTTRPILAYPDGLDCEVIRREALETAHWEATDPEDREHVTRFLWRQPDRFRIGLMPQCCANGCQLDQWPYGEGADSCPPGKCSVLDLKFSVDTVEDLERVCAVYAYLPAGHYDFAATVQAGRAAGLL